MHKDPIDYYVGMWPRPPAFVATNVPVEGTADVTIDVMFFTGKERSVDELDPNTRLLLSNAAELQPVMPDEVGHYAAAVVLLDELADGLFIPDKPTLTSDDKGALDLLRFIIDQQRPGEVERRLRRHQYFHRVAGSLAHYFAGTAAIPAPPTEPVRRHTRSMVRVRGRPPAQS